MKMRTESRFDNADFCRGSIEASKCAPVVDDKASTNYV
jgi:hypothetical protein